MANIVGPHVPGRSVGRVRQWHADKGWGVLDSVATPGGCWCHFSAIEADGYRELLEDELVDFSFEDVEQDGWPFRATTVRRRTEGASLDR